MTPGPTPARLPERRPFRGTIRHIWFTWQDRTPEILRSCILRIHWDNQKHPSVEAPLGDLFGLAHGRTGHYGSIYLGVSEAKGFNCIFPMPFAKHRGITAGADSPKPLRHLDYQISYTVGGELTTGMGRFHAHFRRSRPPRGADRVLLETAGSPGVYLAAPISCLPLKPGAWREGEIRCFLDDDTERAMIAGTVWSDWFLPAWSLGLQESRYAGSNDQVLHPEFGDKYFGSCDRFHAPDPIHFQRDLRVEYRYIGTLPGQKGLRKRAAARARMRAGTDRRDDRREAAAR